jgi:hypothetical protein
MYTTAQNPNKARDSRFKSQPKTSYRDSTAGQQNVSVEVTDASNCYHKSQLYRTYTLPQLFTLPFVYSHTLQKQIKLLSCKYNEKCFLMLQR